MLYGESEREAPSSLQRDVLGCDQSGFNKELATVASPDFERRVARVTFGGENLYSEREESERCEGDYVHADVYRGPKDPTKESRCSRADRALGFLSFVQCAGPTFLGPTFPGVTPFRILSQTRRGFLVFNNEFDMQVPDARNTTVSCQAFLAPRKGE